MKIIGHFGTHRDALRYARDRGMLSFSIQRQGQGWQMHRWVLIDTT